MAPPDLRFCGSGACSAHASLLVQLQMCRQDAFLVFWESVLTDTLILFWNSMALQLADQPSSMWQADAWAGTYSLKQTRCLWR